MAAAQPSSGPRTVMKAPVCPANSAALIIMLLKTAHTLLHFLRLHGQSVLNQANIDYLHTYSSVPLLSKKCFQYDEDNIQCQLTKEIILFNIFFVHTSKYFVSVSVPKIFCKF